MVGYDCMIEVSVIIPVLNEEKYINNCINTIIAQDYPKEKLEVLFVDGMSTDSTRKVLKVYSERFYWIKLLDNKKKIIPCALNIAIEAAEGIYIVRMDAHTEYSTDYISKCLEVIKETHADNVGGPVIAKGKNRKQRSIAAAYYSSFALGGGKQYKETYEGYVDTVFLGCYKKETAMRIGLYDEALPRNEDDEFNLRLIKQGGHIYMSPRIKTIYYPRNSYFKLAEQYFGYGEGKPAVMLKHGAPSTLKQLIPALFVLFLLCGFLLIFFNSVIVKSFYIIVLLLYLVCDLIVTIQSTRVQGLIERAGLFWTHIVIHCSYGAGYLKKIMYIVFR